MWFFLTKVILKFRLTLLILIGVFTVYMGYRASHVKLSYEFVRMLPPSDTAFVDYDQFKTRFGEDGNVLVVGVTNKNMYSIYEFNAFYDLCNELKQMDGIEEVVSITRAVSIGKDDSIKKFTFKSLVAKRPTEQAEVDSLNTKINNLPFYKGLLFNPKTNSYLIAITLDKYKLNDKRRVDLVYSIKEKVDLYASKHQINPHYSGLPYIRTQTTVQVKKELQLFIVLSLIIAAFIMSLFFRTAKAVFSSLIIVAISVICAMGMMDIFGYKITILTGVIPSLLAIIAIENCIYLLNKFHWEYKSHGNKIFALSSVIRRIGFATLITNATTALGFATFVFTKNKILMEFGAIASINVMIEYALSLILIPIIFSYLPAPKERHIKHLENGNVTSFIQKIIYIINNRRTIVYTVLISFLAICVYGTTLIKTSGKVVDDLPESDPIYKDLKFFEKNFGGVMPFEVSIDTKKPNGIMKPGNIKRIEAFQQKLSDYNLLAIKKGITKDSIFSRPLSIVEFIKYTKQAFYNGNPDMYEMPNNNDRAFIFSYIPKETGAGNLLHSFKDSTNRYTRISVQMADVGSKEMAHALSYLRPQVDSIFDSTCNVVITGNSVVYTKGTDFLIGNLLESVLIGIVLICLLMALVFSSARMILIAMVCNLIPLVMTSAIMGFFNIPLKPSTLIVFSVALGISIDNAVLFLSKYRHELRLNSFNVQLSVENSLKETGISMIYSSIVLVLGFAVFMISDFGGTQALGLLISLTLFMALFFNLIVLPAMLLSIERLKRTRTLTEPFLDVLENPDLDEEIEIEKNIPIEEFEERK